LQPLLLLASVIPRLFSRDPNPTPQVLETPVHQEVWFIPAVVLAGMMVVMLPTLLYMCCRVVAMTLEPVDFNDYAPPLALEYPGYDAGTPVQQLEPGGSSVAPPLMLEAGGGSRHMMPLRGGSTGSAKSPTSHKKVHPAGDSETRYDKV
jgi:hypothetical protein